MLHTWIVTTLEIMGVIYGTLMLFLIIAVVVGRYFLAIGKTENIAMNLAESETESELVRLLLWMEREKTTHLDSMYIRCSLPHGEDGSARKKD